MLKFVLAEKLGCTVAELERRMSAEEFDEWAIFFDLRAEAEKAAMDKASKR